MKYDGVNRFVSGPRHETITFAPRNHLLTNTNTWTPDTSGWYLTCVLQGRRLPARPLACEYPYWRGRGYLSRVTGRTVGVVTVHPKSEKYVFIHGPEILMKHGITISIIGAESLLKRQGEQSRCNGYYCTVHPRSARGGSHVHVFSPNGEMVSFTLTTM